MKQIPLFSSAPVEKYLSVSERSGSINTASSQTKYFKRTFESEEYEKIP